jgi:ATP/maltotriose-dependent transcriptional regulator MalT
MRTASCGVSVPTASSAWLASISGLRTAVGSGAAEVAERAAGEIAEVAARAPNAGLLAGALVAEGRLDAARGELREAQITLGEAAARFDAAGAPYEAALACLDAAAAAHAAGDLFQAAEGRRVAREALRVLGAALPEERNDLLSPREAEVVRLLARGLSNEDIAHTLGA